jgi:hypothetical protein
MSRKNRNRPPSIARHLLRAINVAWNTPDRPLFAVRQSPDFLRWCSANGLTATRKRAAKFMRLRAAEPVGGGLSRQASELRAIRDRARRIVEIADECDRVVGNEGAKA